MATPKFAGKIELDVRDSTPDWTPYLPPTAPKGAPNILFVLYDDTGQTAWSPYGGRIEMCEGTDFFLFLKAVSDGVVYYDPALKLEGAT